MSTNPWQTWVVHTKTSSMLLSNVFHLIKFHTALIAIAKKRGNGVPVRSKDFAMQINNNTSIFCQLRSWEALSKTDLPVLRFLLFALATVIHSSFLWKYVSWEHRGWNSRNFKYMSRIAPRLGMEHNFVCSIFANKTHKYVSRMKFFFLETQNKPKNNKNSTNCMSDTNNMWICQSLCVWYQVLMPG